MSSEITGVPDESNPEEPTGSLTTDHVDVEKDSKNVPLEIEITGCTIPREENGSPDVGLQRSDTETVLNAAEKEATKTAVSQSPCAKRKRRSSSGSSESFGARRIKSVVRDEVTGTLVECTPYAFGLMEDGNLCILLRKGLALTQNVEWKKESPFNLTDNVDEESLKDEESSKDGPENRKKELRPPPAKRAKKIKPPRKVHHHKKVVDKNDDDFYVSRGRFEVKVEHRKSSQDDSDDSKESSLKEDENSPDNETTDDIKEKNSDDDDEDQSSVEDEEEEIEEEEEKEDLADQKEDEGMIRENNPRLADMRRQNNAEEGCNLQ